MYIFSKIQKTDHVIIMKREKNTDEKVKSGVKLTEFIFDIVKKSAKEFNQIFFF